MKSIAIFCWLFLLSEYAMAKNVWIPSAQFQLENSTLQQTTIFISGLSYGLTYFSHTLDKQKVVKPFCLKEREVVSADLVFDILNKQFKGKKITAEQASDFVMHELQSRFPCKK